MEMTDTEKRYLMAEIEQAVNYWRSAKGGHDGLTLGRQASQLATLYGTMIFHRADSVRVADLDEDTAQLIAFALRPMSLTPPPYVATVEQRFEDLAKFYEEQPR